MDRSWVFRSESNEIGIIRYFDEKIAMYLHQDFSFKQEILDFKNSLEKVFPELQQNFCENDLIIYVRNNLHVEISEIKEVSDAGYFYPRIANELINFNYASNEFLNDVRAYQNIQNSIEELSTFIELDKNNFTVYGHKIRELLIISCTEVEYLLKRLLVENGYPIDGKKLKTKHYYECKDILKLNEYTVETRRYPNLKIFSPFANWTNENNRTSGSLPWYEAYNKVKHDRGGKFTQANLENLMDATAAIHILLEAQYGKNIFNKFKNQTEDKSLFFTTNSPNWELEKLSIPLLEIKKYQGIVSNWIGIKKFFN
ncbi:hypothetical protein ACQUGU_03140 [Acinetobacter baumannii]|uniref:hypothetical protein n=1 Tax=Acinetobacter calcoaceticus/baumannii complex TaxID=909768 RepID=UPI002A022EC0|nr:hypothetical protein [Acinetobacter pittii]MDX8163546.1 hypothetical protein [Acinetobacter pittii]